MQVNLLRAKFDEALGSKARQLVDVSTIDGFQVCICAPWCSGLHDTFLAKSFRRLRSLRSMKLLGLWHQI